MGHFIVDTVIPTIVGITGIDVLMEIQEFKVTLPMITLVYKLFDLTYAKMELRLIIFISVKVRYPG